MFKNVLNEIIENIGTIAAFIAIVVIIVWASVSGLGAQVSDWFGNISFFE
jgi:hypothetical protein